MPSFFLGTYSGASTHYILGVTQGSMVSGFRLLETWRFRVRRDVGFGTDIQVFHS